MDETPDSTGGQTESFWILIFQQVSASLTIEDIEINQLKHRTRGHQHYSLSTSWFRPLADLNNVKSLVITGSALSDSDEDFRVMAVGFHKLKKLVVPPAYYSQGRTVACLFYFSRYCPELYEIKICLGFDIVKNPDAVKNLPRTDHHNPLEKLYVNSDFGRIQITHMIEVLDLLFPKLSILETYHSNATEVWGWTGIRKIRVALQAARMNALHRVKSEAGAESNN